jgi:hypothetical protein
MRFPEAHRGFFIFGDNESTILISPSGIIAAVKE